MGTESSVTSPSVWIIAAHAYPVVLKNTPSFSPPPQLQDEAVEGEKGYKEQRHVLYVC